MKTLKCAIIGCGSISHTHVSAIRQGGKAKIVAVCDIKKERCAELASLIGENVREYGDYKKMLSECKGIDVVHVCTPHYLHAEMAIAAMHAGCDVYLEKPCAMNAEEAKKIVAVSDETGRRVCVSFQNRAIPTTLVAKEKLESGKLGKLLGMKGIVTWDRGGAYYTESGWRGAWATEGGGVLMNQSIHTLDLIYYFGGKVKKAEGSVALRKNRGTIEVEDTAEATIWFESGATAIFYATNCHVTSSPIELELVCEKGSLLIRNDTLYECVDGDLKPACTSGGPAVGKTVWGAGHAEMIDRFYCAVLGSAREDYCDIRDAWQVLEIIGGIYDTSANKLR